MVIQDLGSPRRQPVAKGADLSDAIVLHPVADLIDTPVRHHDHTAVVGHGEPLIDDPGRTASSATCS
jgi:hypothetical protein